MVWWVNLKERELLEDQGLDGRIIWKEVGCGGMNWIDLSQDRDMWGDVVNAEMNLRVPYNSRNILTS
jgi:hypothetical protein